MRASIPPSNGHALLERLFGAAALPADANAGLVFHRVMRLWQDDRATGLPTRRLKEDALKRALGMFVTDFNKRAGMATWTELLAAQHRRLDGVLGASGVTVTFRATWRMATGLGAAHPLDNGFTFEHLTGVPFLAGSSVKGLCRAYAALVELDPATERSIFGHPIAGAHGDADDGDRTGSVVFFPALPAGWPELDVDIINCHHPTYYVEADPSQQDRVRPRSKGPLETESPVPVSFLSLKEGTAFTFRICRRTPDVADSLLDEARTLLGEALRTLGIGAKTAVGYGVMAHSDEGELG